jgi:hypothetical protein
LGKIMVLRRLFGQTRRFGQSLSAQFGEALRSRGHVAQINELLCKVLCHNLCCLIQSMYELGIEPEFVGK